MMRRLNHLMWLLPVLTGIAGYGLRGGVFSSAGSRWPVAIHEARERKWTNAREALASVPYQLKAEQEQHAQRLAELSPAEIRQRLLALTPPVRQGQFDPSYMAFWEERNSLIEALAKHGGAEAATWVQDKLPMLRHLYMDAWVEIDPEAALDFVVHSQRPTPCCMWTLQTLLDMRAKSGAVALREAIDEIPWYLFDPSNERDTEMPGISPGSDIAIDPASMSVGAVDEDEARSRMWLESGAARAIAERGIPVSGALNQWFQIDPQHALSEWADWPRRADVTASYDLLEIVGGLASSPEGSETLRGYFQQADPATAGALKQALLELGDDPSWHPEFRQFTGENFSPATPPDDE